MSGLTSAITISFPVQTVTAEAVELWADRAMGDFEKKVGKNAPSKQKARIWGNFSIQSFEKSFKSFSKSLATVVQYQPTNPGRSWHKETSTA